MNAVTETRNTNSIFSTKEQYLAFRAKWKQLHTDGFHKPQRVEYYGGFRMVSPLTVWHHLVFNLAIGRTPPTKAFRVPTEASGYSKPVLWHALNYTFGAKHDFAPFGDALDDEQKAKLTQMVKDFRATL
jgi:hypothetical protein